MGESMKINKITPQGYCGGVKIALSMVNQALHDPKYPKPIYLLGSIIHNHHVIKKLQEQGVILLEEPGKSKGELLQSISSGTIVLSAHGSAPQIYQYAQKQGLTILDTTCKNVCIIHDKIKHYLNEGYTCFYIGTKNHPECEGIIGISSAIHLISNENDIPNLPFRTNKIYVTNQTTLSIFDTQKIYDEIKNKYPTAILDNKICNATTIRQKALFEQEPVDLCLVVGDSSSSNTKKLVLASQKAQIPTLLIDSVDDLKKIDLSPFNSISITSGASTPEEIVDEVIKYLKRAN